MAHRYDRRVHDHAREEQVQQQIHWHAAINKDLARNGLAPVGNMAQAINKAYDHSVIHTKTAHVAHDIRRAGNAAKHNFK